ncbi:MAG: GIY-YIG nuclease family protein [Brevundimonas sp.]|nr:GIY-YIG nuclease family protein [Brevundimonas sp.]
MKIDALVPRPSASEPFRRDRQKFIPSAAGCYVLTTFGGDVLYVGLAVDIQRRMGQHLDTPAKRAPTPLGRAVVFHWLLCADLEKVERTWMNTHIQHEGRLPHLNGAYSPISV